MADLFSVLGYLDLPTPPPQPEALLLLTTGMMDKMALVSTLVQKDDTEPPGNTAQ